MNKVLIGKACTVNPKTEGDLSLQHLCSFIPMEFVSDEFGTITRQSIRPVAEVIKGYTFFRENDVLFAKITPCMENGKVAIAKNLKNGFGFGSTEFHVLRANEGEITPHWIFYFLRQDNVRKEAERRMTGSAGQQRVPTSFLEEELEIPLPSLPEQKRIAAILDKADRLRRQRRFAQTLSDSFLQSVFIKMFGDPAANPFKWAEENLRSLSEKFSDGPFGSNLKTEHYVESGVRVIRLQNIGVSEFIDDDKAFISKEYFEKELSKHRCLPNDVIIGTMGDPNLRACILPKSIPDALNKADCVQFRPRKDKVNSEFVCWLLNMPSTLYLASGIILGQTRSRISMGRLAELYVPLPPLSLQEKFAAIVQKFERIRRQQREATRQAEHLFQTLLHRAFRGEL